MKGKIIRPGADLRSALRRHITRSFLPRAGLRSFQDSDSFLKKGILDSTGVLELLEFIEDRFGIKVEDDEIIPENLDSVDRLARYVQKKLTHAGS
jgi:acyl carrier protein